MVGKGGVFGYWQNLLSPDPHTQTKIFHLDRIFIPKNSAVIEQLSSFFLTNINVVSDLSSIESNISPASSIGRA